MIKLANVAENTFNSEFAAVRFEITNGQFSVNPDHVQVFHTRNVVDSASIQVTASAIVASGLLDDGLNEIELFARDSNGLYIVFGATLWAGSGELSGLVVDENAEPIEGAVVTAHLGTDPRVRGSATTTATGEFSFSNVPAWTVILESTSSGNRHASAAVRGTTDFIELQAQPIGAPSSVANNDFSLGTDGWEIGTAPVEIVAHEDETRPPRTWVQPPPTSI